MDKKLVVFQVYTGEKQYVRNLLHFLHFSQLPKPDVDLIVVQVGEPIKDAMDLFPDVTFVPAMNHNLDFGAYCSLLSTLDTAQYSKFLFINSSVRGPYLSARDNGEWFDIYFSLINDSVQLVGSTINLLPKSTVFGSFATKVFGNKDYFPHVQSMAFALGDKAMKLLLETGFWDLRPNLSKTEIILTYELGMSQILLEAGYSIQSLVREPGIINASSSLSSSNTAINGDMHFRNAYSGRTLTPTELVFIKTNRRMISSKNLRRSTRAQLHRIESGNKGQNRKLRSWLNKYKLV